MSSQAADLLMSFIYPSDIILCQQKTLMDVNFRRGFFFDCRNEKRIQQCVQRKVLTEKCKKYFFSHNISF